MSIASELNNLRTNISNAYDSINTKGGTVPQNKNTANLATAIDSISGGGGISDYWEMPITITSQATSGITKYVKQIPPITVDSSTTSINSLLNGTTWTALTEATLSGGGSSLTTISYLFSDDTRSSALTTVDLSNLQVGVISTLERLCYQCSNLESIQLPNLLSAPTGNVTMQNMFYRCGSLKRIDLTELGQSFNAASMSNCFRECTLLEYLDMSNILGATNWSNFLASCSSLTTLILGGTSVLPINSTNYWVNSGITSGICTIYVPDNLVEQYKTDTNYIWRYYASQIKGVSELPS